MTTNSFLKIITRHLALFSLLVVQNAFAQHPQQEILVSNWQHGNHRTFLNGGSENLPETVSSERWYANSFSKTSTDSEVLGWNVTEVLVTAMEWYNHGYTGTIIFPGNPPPVVPVSDRRDPPFAIYDTRTGTLDDDDEAIVPGEPIITFSDEYSWRSRQPSQNSYFFVTEGTPTRDLRIDPGELYYLVMRSYGSYGIYPYFLTDPGSREVTGSGASITVGAIGAKDLSGADTVNSAIEWQTDRPRFSGTLSNHSLMFRILGTPILLGDLNNDLERDVSDYLLLNFHVLGFQLLPTHFHDSADINRDGEIDMTDLHLIRFLMIGGDVMAGDLNDDDSVNLFDLVLINDHISTTNLLSSDALIPANIEFNTNADGTPSINDNDRNLLIDLILSR